MLKDVEKAVEEKKQASTTAEKAKKNIEITFAVVGTLAFLFQGLVAFYEYRKLRRK